VREGYTEKLKSMKEGCQLRGLLEVNKVAGNFHIAPGKSFEQQHSHIHDITPFLQSGSLTTKHTIKRLSFGEEFPNIFNPLDGFSKMDIGLFILP